jgi:hypothetical protein
MRFDATGRRCVAPNYIARENMMKMVSVNSTGMTKQ